MIRFAVCQFRTQGLAAAVALVALAIIAATTGPHLVHLYDTTVVGCQRTGDCGQARAAITAADGHLYSWLGALALVVPAVVGVFWGAPLIARELESGTFRLAWTQSVTKVRWLTVKFALVGLAAMAVAALVSVIVTWWASPVDTAAGNTFAAMFGRRGVVPAAYAAFAFALGATLGLLARRTLPAMAATLAGYVAVRIAVLEWIRPHLASPLRLVSTLQPGPQGAGSRVGNGLGPDDWVLGKQTIDLHQVITYQPQSRYWPFQWGESAIFLALAVLLVGFCFWWVRRAYAGRGQGLLDRREPSRAARAALDASAHAEVCGEGAATTSGEGSKEPAPSVVSRIRPP